MLHYNIARTGTTLPIARSCRRTSTPSTTIIIPVRGIPPAAVSPSILRMSILERLAIAAALIALLWGAVVWAMMG